MWSGSPGLSSLSLPLHSPLWHEPFTASLILFPEMHQRLQRLRPPPPPLSCQGLRCGRDSTHGHAESACCLPEPVRQGQAAGAGLPGPLGTGRKVAAHTKARGMQRTAGCTEEGAGFLQTERPAHQPAGSAGIGRLEGSGWRSQGRPKPRDRGARTGRCPHSTEAGHPGWPQGSGFHPSGWQSSQGAPWSSNISSS